MNSIKLYKSFFLIHLKGLMTHKLSCFLTTLGQFFISFHLFLGVYFMMQRFHQVKGFTYPEVLLCFAITLMALTLAETFFRSFDTFDSMIANGEFDRILLRPRNSVFLVLCSKIELTRVGRLLQAVVMLVYGISHSRISWTMDRRLLVLLMILGGASVFAAIYMIFAGICFFTLEGLEFMNVFTDGAREYGKYPIGIYGKNLLAFCTWVVPFALFQYYPFLYITGKSARVWYFFLPLAACLFLCPAIIFWNLGLKRYQSTGS